MKLGYIFNLHQGFLNSVDWQPLYYKMKICYTTNHSLSLKYKDLDRSNLCLPMSLSISVKIIYLFIFRVPIEMISRPRDVATSTLRSRALNKQKIYYNYLFVSK